MLRRETNYAVIKEKLTNKVSAPSAILILHCTHAHFD